MSQKIIPNLWFNGNAREAVEFYTSAFADAKITGGSKYPASEAEGLADFQKDLAGKDLTVDFEIAEFKLSAINAGPEFKPTPANSFFVNFDPSKDADARENLDKLWQKLMEGGKALMPLQEYPWSKHYGWVEDKFGFSWQLILTDPEGDDRPTIIPALMFGGRAQNRAKEAIDYYLASFKDSKPGLEVAYGQQTGPAKPESIMFADLSLAGNWFTAMDSGAEQDFTFTEAVSYVLICKDQAEIDYYWSKLSADPKFEQCGWCKDKFGVSWQIVPQNMEELMGKPEAFKVMMQQKKIIISEY
jgi:predicted 3-demethylubiquinone-9 3-methyltransferase (glyoxalase superfamily)